MGWQSRIVEPHPDDLATAVMTMVLVDRLVHRIEIVAIKSESCRARDARKRADLPKS